MRCFSDTLNEILQVEETAHAPLGGASPQTVESVAEKKINLPTAMDCTTLALVDAAQSNPASLRDAARTLLAENQDCSVEPKNCHGGACSAAPVAQNEFSSSLTIAQGAVPKAIANQTPGQVEQGQSASLSGENQVSGLEVKADHEGVRAASRREGSALPVPQSEKWSRRAIVARSNMRQSRMQKLKVAANSGENPGFDFLLSCWDDPALQIVIKKLLAKFPQWGIACVDGVLVDWEE
ncbi:hypothetical protein FNW02_33340 [Komarekiella sp. 'clone 1']|uniref:Uncharacterized protein n=2 Tax=Komarekiella TaxID=2022127 RepID=A0AA40VUS2_9NOST|nr:hypothetical protein [Komarekiella delphini-convector SJRDD-AB1]